MGEILVPQRQENMSRKVVGLNPDAAKKFFIKYVLQ